MLFGNYDVSIDGKNRMPVPADIRRAIDVEQDGAAFFVVPGANKRPWLYPDKYYKTLAAQRPVGLTPSESELAYGHLNFSLACLIEPDGQGRVLLPEKTIRKAGLTKEVTVVGNQDHLEIWSREDWAARERELEEKRAEIVCEGKTQRPARMG